MLSFSNCRPERPRPGPDADPRNGTSRLRDHGSYLCLATAALAAVALLGLAGAAGTLLRAGCTTLATRLLGNGFPWGTLAMNVAGSLVFGLIVGLARTRGTIGVATETILLVGLLGGFTTFSSYAFQSVEMLEGGRPLTAAAYVIGTNIAALAAVWAGLRIAGG